MFSGFLLTQSCATYTHYVRFAKFQLKNEQLFPLPESSRKEAGKGKNMDGHLLYTSVEEEMMVMGGAADFFIKNPTKASPFYAASFYKEAKLVLKDLRELYTPH